MRLQGLPWWLIGKEYACNIGDTGDVRSVLESGRSPAEGSGIPLQCSCMKNPMDRGAWRATARRVSKSQT